MWVQTFPEAQGPPHWGVYEIVHLPRKWILPSLSICASRTWLACLQRQNTGNQIMDLVLDNPSLNASVSLVGFLGMYWLLLISFTLGKVGKNFIGPLLCTSYCFLNSLLGSLHWHSSETKGVNATAACTPPHFSLTLNLRCVATCTNTSPSPEFAHGCWSLLEECYELYLYIFPPGVH